MRRFLEKIYKISGFLSAFSLIASCLIVFAQVLGRIIDKLYKFFTGEVIGLMVPSAADFIGCLLVSASFFGLAFTLNNRQHIRVKIVIEQVGSGWQKLLECFSYSTAVIVSGYFSYYTYYLMVDSLEFSEVTPGIIPIPLWIPQLAMLIGVAFFMIAAIDGLIKNLSPASKAPVNN
ncbi:TRAP transporter small permease [Spartinivicinus poritis]|uniref:TRAP transporter small permease protein n=1 Tax=Spartinivicinus poritis TaxID=2994640 RepID=A0ABT5UG51_9GAMM|nr:TRAP transporter small permease [Spartinivicinus sp. A2-2]MDE1465365.1 TRAP transporter small permease [Spartinivicinus sp. A2-2]